MKELRVGIAGLGRLGRVHAANLAHKIPGAVLTAACVPGADSQAYARQELGLEKVYGDFREMVADPELDAVAIVSPSGEHCWQIEAALDAGQAPSLHLLEDSRTGEGPRSGRPPFHFFDAVSPLMPARPPSGLPSLLQTQVPEG